MRKSTGAYPANWTEIATRVKDAAGWCCVRCHHKSDFWSGHVLTVHHLDMCPTNNTWWNLAALCQRCHLHVQAKVVMTQGWMFEHSEWMKPFVAGYYAHVFKQPEDQEFVLAHVDELINFAQYQIQNDSSGVWDSFPVP